MENKKIRCSYPSCKKEALYNHALNLINKKDNSVSLPFCPYHFYIVMGNHFKARILKETQNLLGEKREQDFELIGPLKEVEVAEQVFASIEMIKNEKEKTKKTLE